MISDLICCWKYILSSKSNIAPLIHVQSSLIKFLLNWIHFTFPCTCYSFQNYPEGFFLWKNKLDVLSNQVFRQVKDRKQLKTPWWIWHKICDQNSKISYNIGKNRNTKTLSLFAHNSILTKKTDRIIAEMSILRTVLKTFAWKWRHNLLFHSFNRKQMKMNAIPIYQTTGCKKRTRPPIPCKKLQKCKRKI